MHYLFHDTIQAEGMLHNANYPIHTHIKLSSHPCQTKKKNSFYTQHTPTVLSIYSSSVISIIDASLSSNSSTSTNDS